MSRKEIEISCPCCEARLAVDLRTEKVTRWQRAEELDPSGKPVVRESDWDAIQSRVAQREGGAVDKFDQALGRERSREKDLDALFDKMKDRAEDDEEE